MSFKSALQERLKKLAIKGKDIQRLQRQIAYDRLLCRLFIDKDIQWILKGGHAVELRIHESRGTKDIDLALKDMKPFKKDGQINKEAIFDLLQEKASIDLDDFFVFTVGKPIMDLDAAPYGGARFPITASLAGKAFVKFHMDVGVGDIWLEPHDQIELLHDWLGFANIKTQTIPLISKEQHFAEKIHAYTIIRDSGFNSRVKDLVDLVLLINDKNINLITLKKAIAETFKRRNTHALPKTLLPPPNEWEKPFAFISSECGLTTNMQKAFSLLEEYYLKIFA